MHNPVAFLFRCAASVVAALVVSVRVDGAELESDLRARATAALTAEASVLRQLVPADAEQALALAEFLADAEPLTNTVAMLALEIAARHVDTHATPAANVGWRIFTRKLSGRNALPPGPERQRLTAAVAAIMGAPAVNTAIEAGQLSAAAVRTLRRRLDALRGDSNFTTPQSLDPSVISRSS